MENQPGTSKDSEKSATHTNDNNKKNSLHADKSPTKTPDASRKSSASSPTISMTQGFNSDITAAKSASHVRKELQKGSEKPTLKKHASQVSHKKSGLTLLEEFESTESVSGSGSVIVPPEPEEADYTDILIDSIGSNEKNSSPGESQERNMQASKTPHDDLEDREVRKRRREQRPSYLRRQLLDMERKLELENIEKEVSRVFSLEFSRKDSEEVKVEEIPSPRIYMSPSMAVIFIVSIMTGSSMTTVPFYLKMSNWFGVFLIILLSINAMYAGLCIGWSWLILEEIWPEYSEYSRIPYQEIGYRAFGTGMKYFTYILIDVSIVGICSVYMIFIADSIGILLSKYIVFCHTVFIVTAVLLLFIMFGSYRDMKFIGILDVLLSILISFFLILSFFLDKPSQPQSIFRDPTLDTIIIAFGGFSYAFGYGPALSNIMLDMKDRTLFAHSLATALIVGTVIYMFIAIMGFGAYGERTSFNVLHTILTNETYSTMGHFINCLYILQVMTSFVSFLMPTLLAFEVRVSCPDCFCLYRFLLRGFILLCILLLVLSVPSLTKYAEIVGATTINFTTFILPPAFYVSLVYQQSATNSKWHISKKEWVLIAETVLLGFCLAIASSLTRYDTASKLFVDRISCFLNMTYEDPRHKQYMMQGNPAVFNNTTLAIEIVD